MGARRLSPGRLDKLVLPGVGWAGAGAGAGRSLAALGRTTRGRMA